MLCTLFRIDESKALGRSKNCPTSHFAFQASVTSLNLCAPALLNHAYLQNATLETKCSMKSWNTSVSYTSILLLSLCELVRLPLQLLPAIKAGELSHATTCTTHEVLPLLPTTIPLHQSQAPLPQMLPACQHHKPLMLYSALQRGSTILLASELLLL